MSDCADYPHVGTHRYTQYTPLHNDTLRIIHII